MAGNGAGVNTLLTSSRDTWVTMTKPYILNQYERAALMALSQQAQVSAQTATNRSFSRTHLETLLNLGLATRLPSRTEPARDDFAITDAGWRCMYGLSKVQIDRQTERKPVPFRIWQWPLPADLKKAA